mmetsp:Transcript_78208/g.234383  ORF Transcript_78208/g.234383 Transcript_78208/m.234383 type:complete len:181 (+) Transcript_78208:1-543(+)
MMQFARLGRRALSTSADWALHYRRAAKMYRLAPVNGTDRYSSRVRLSDRKAVVQAPVKPEYCHAAHALHGSSYFKMLDDACFFAAQSTNRDHFVVTTSFTTYITRPVVPDQTPFLIAEGTVVSASKSLIIAEGVVKTPDGTEVGRGSGTFMPHPKMELPKVPFYADDEAYPFVDDDQVLE